VTLESAEFNAAMAAPRRVEPPREEAVETAPPSSIAPPAQDNSPVLSAAATPAEPKPAPVPAAPAPPSQTESVPVTAAPLFRQRQDIPKSNPSSIPAVIPIIRPPDDPGIDEDAVADEFAEQVGPQRQAGGWRGFLSRWGG